MKATCTQLCGGSKSDSHHDESDDNGSIPYTLYPNDDASLDEKPVSPFIKYDDNKEKPYVWPSLYEEMDDMFDICCLLYAWGELRLRARLGEFDDPAVLQLPLTSLDVWNVVQMHQQQPLQEDASSFGTSSSSYVELLEVLSKRQQKIVASSGSFLRQRLQMQLVAFNDCYFLEEMVYGIAVNPTQQRITVYFRGSTSKMDWSMSEEVYMTSVDNPVKTPDSNKILHAGSKLLIHHGFYNYLCAPLRQVRQEAERRWHHQESVTEAAPAEEEEENGLSQYQQILQLHILPLLKQYPGYKIYVTGHSLGAALATLFAFLIAAEPDSVIPKPVTCISFGSPYVGDESFRLAHQTLESLGKLRHLRVSNYQDMVTLVPFLSFRLKVWDSDAHIGTMFKHAGMNLRLFASATTSAAVPFQITYPKVRNTQQMACAWDELKRAWDYSWLANWSWDWAVIFAWKNHHVTEYQRRIDANQPILEVMYLNDLYANKAIVGNLIADF